MYIIVLKDGKIINVKADGASWDVEDRSISFFNGQHLVSAFNVDNIVGWINTNYMAESDGKK